MWTPLEFLDHEQIDSLRRRARELRQPAAGRPFPGLRRELRLEGVTFAHPGREPALRDLSMAIPKGAMIAVVGESGAGKSSLIDLLLGLLEPQSGRVLADGVPLQDLDPVSYRGRLGFVPQDSPLFSGTIRDNLLWAKPDAAEPDLREALARANAEEFVLRLPQGLDTEVGDRGVRLSGGQVQRLALARALVRRPDLLVLDEATSSLDTESERLIQKAVESLSEEVTVVAVAHRLSTVVNADRIFVLEAGRLIEQGSCEELLAQGGRFRRMAALQGLEGGRA